GAVLECLARLPVATPLTPTRGPLLVDRRPTQGIGREDDVQLGAVSDDLPLTGRRGVGPLARFAAVDLGHLLDRGAVRRGEAEGLDRLRARLAPRRGDLDAGADPPGLGQTAREAGE